MEHSKETQTVVLEYVRPGRRRWWRRFVLSLLVAYLLAYAILRLTGVYYAYYSQGSWEIAGGTGIDAIDLAFLPLSLAEDAVQNQLRVLPEPTGG